MQDVRPIVEASYDFGKGRLEINQTRERVSSVESQSLDLVVVKIIKYLPLMKLKDAVYVV